MLKTAWKFDSGPTPAWKPPPWAGMVVQVPSAWGTMSVKGLVPWFTGTALLQKLVEGGLKLRAGNVWWNDGVLAEVALKTPEPTGSG